MSVGEEQLRELGGRLTGVGGVVGVLLGGSRARGEHTPKSDGDLGLHYRGTLDVAALGDLAREVAGAQARVTLPGEWGPWVDGGGWLTINGTAVDWIYRDLDRVQRAWRDACKGRFSFHGQVGHPLGVPDFAYAGEVALGVILADPTGELAELQRLTKTYPTRLADAVVQRCLWEASFLIDIARKGVSRADATYVAGCLFRALGMCAHALHGHARRWLINEKGAITAAAQLSGAPAEFTARAHGILAGLGTSPAELTTALDAATALLHDTTNACQTRTGAGTWDAPVRLVDYDPDWPQDFAQQAARVRAVLGAHALAVEHVGSTAVPGLSAKPVIDMLVVVADSADEDSYLPLLQAAGYPLRIREPGWHQHRLFNGPEREINLHVFSVGSPEIDRLLRFRDQLRRNPADRDLYATTKRRLASRQWTDVQSYVDAKSNVIETILARTQPVSQ